MPVAASTVAIRAIGADEVELVQGIEREAASRFRTAGLAAVADGDVSNKAFIRSVMRFGVALGAEDGVGGLAGFALAGEIDDALHLQELSVATAFGRRGIGSALIAAIEQAARRRGRRAVTLSTFVDVPWNAPFYARRGFQRVEEPDWSPGFFLLRIAERAACLPLDRRIFMRKELS